MQREGPDDPGEAHHRGTGSGISAVLQSITAAAPAGEKCKGHRTHRVLGTSRNPEPLPADPLQIPFLSVGPDPARSGKSQGGLRPKPQQRLSPSQADSKVGLAGRLEAEGRYRPQLNASAVSQAGSVMEFRKAADGVGVRFDPQCRLGSVA